MTAPSGCVGGFDGGGGGVVRDADSVLARVF